MLNMIVKKLLLVGLFINLKHLNSRLANEALTIKVLTRVLNINNFIVENQGQNCYIPTSGMFFIKCIKYFTDKD